MKICRFTALAFLALVATAIAADRSDSQKTNPKDPTPAQLYREGEKAERSGQVLQAYLYYSQAAAKEPANRVYWTRAQALRPVASMADTLAQKTTAAPGKVSRPADVDPAVSDTITDDDIAQAERQPLPPYELKAAPGPKDFDLKADSKTLFEQVGKAFNLTVVFDAGYQPTQPVRFAMTGVDYRQALRALEDATASFIVPVGDRLILVANDTQQKRTELESTAAIVIPVPEPIAIQDVQEIATGVRGALDIQRLLVDSTRRIVLIKDRVWKVRAAEMLFHDLMKPRPQVAVEVEFVSISKTNSKTFGLDLPTKFPVVSFGGLLGKWPKNLLTSSIPAGFASFLSFGGGASFIGLGVTSATLWANATKAESTTLLKSDVVTTDGLPASLTVGEKYPIVTASYSAPPNTTGAFVPPPQVNFEDLGLVMKITPHVHGLDEISLDVSADFKLLDAGAVDGIPVVSQRKYESKVRLMTGEWAVLTGLVTQSDIKTITGIPGLMAIPLFRKTTTEDDHTETMIVMKPHLLTLPPTEALAHIDWIGTETRGRGL